MRVFLILFGALNGLLYSSLLPLWEGFDEPFHYAYVQDLSRHQRLPVLGRADLSAEVWRSLELAPASYLVARNIPGLRTFSEYFHLPAPERRALRDQLDRLDPALGREATGRGNYEAQQAPLAYALLAIPDRLWSEVPLPARVWRLRVLAALAAVTAVVLLTLRLASRLGLADPFACTAVFLALSTQMFYASVARIGNDWLAIPLGIALCLAAVEVYARPDTRTVCALAAILAVGLLTKAYFLGLVPLAAGVVAWQCLRARLAVRTAALGAVIVLVLAGPWYGRNWTLYGSLSATQQAAGGIGPGQVAPALGHFPWLRAAYLLARDSLWTGNNSFTTFSAATIHLMLLALGLAAVLWLGSRPAPAERLLLAGSGVYLAGVLYAALVTFVYTRGGLATGAWYTQPVLPALWGVLLAGLARRGKAGRGVICLVIILWAYVLGATYVAKLLPLYGGYEGSARLGALLRWYSAGDGGEMLSSACLAPAGMLYALTAVVVAGAVALGIALGVAVTRGPAAAA